MDNNFNILKSCYFFLYSFCGKFIRLIAAAMASAVIEGRQGEDATAEAEAPAAE